MMRWGFVVLVALHGLLHLMGFAKGFGLAELPRLSQPISRPMGVAWLAAAVVLLGTAGLVAVGQRSWWIAALVAVILSQIVIAASWGDARFGTIANVIILAAAAYGFASEGPLSFRSEYRAGVREHLARTPTPSDIVTEGHLARLPEPVARYVRLSGAVGRPRVRHVASEWRGRIRAEPGDPWMPFTARQHNFVDDPARFYRMDARRGGLPVDVFHAFEGGAATMRVRLMSLIPLVDASGPELTRSETVTIFNDLCLLAPAALVDPAVEWDAVDARSAEARYALGRNTIGARLEFDDEGRLVNFVSDDRSAASPGGALTRRRWSTPLSDYRAYGPRRAAGHGEGRWHDDERTFTYIEVELLGLRVNPVA